MKKYHLLLSGIIMTIFLFLVPYAYHIDNGPGPDSLVAMLWDLRFETPEPFYILYRTLGIFFEYNFVRILFLIVFFVFLTGKIKNKYIVLSGFITELAVLLISIPRIYIVNSEGETLSPVLIPIPTLLIFTILTVYLLTRANKKI